MIYQEHAHRKLRRAFDAILQQFSSNGNRKSMLSANRSFQAENSTCSTLLQTMLLYETCIVLSRKCSWDVNKDFWHQWRSLVITTLSSTGKFRFHTYRPDKRMSDTILFRSCNEYHKLYIVRFRYRDSLVCNIIDCNKTREYVCDIWVANRVCPNCVDWEKFSLVRRRISLEKQIRFFLRYKVTQY